MHRDATVLVYHAIDRPPPGRRRDYLWVPPRRFAAQMAYLARHRRVVTLEALLAGTLPRDLPAVAITFDDGYRNILTNALPILQRHAFPATAFVPTKWIGKTSEWLQAPAPIMTADELRELEWSGVEIESHGHSHLDLARASTREAETDIRESWERLGELLGREPRYLAYPWGRHTRTAKRLVAASGFQAAFALEDSGHERFAYERAGIGPSDSRLRFALKTSGRYTRVRRHPVFSRANALRQTLTRRAPTMS